MTQATMTVRAHAIDPARLAAMRSTGADEHGNRFTGYPALGWEPLRCCLRLAEAGEEIALIAYAPFRVASPWAEVGPVYVHACECAGYVPDAGLPDALRTGPRVLRGYRADGSLDYGHVTVVGEGDDIESELQRLFAAPEVAVVHVRALTTQCFTYAVTG